MKKSEHLVQKSEQTIPLFGNHLIRHVLLGDILGKEYESILYWSGKSLARKYPLTSEEEILHFFNKSGWGSLNVKKQTNYEKIYELVSVYHTEKVSLSYQLEAGFLAEQNELQTQCLTEAIVTEKRDRAVITLKWDKY